MNFYRCISIYFTLLSMYMMIKYDTAWTVLAYYEFLLHLIVRVWVSISRDAL